jgi:CheY-like chemotaxis protein
MPEEDGYQFMSKVRALTIDSQHPTAHPRHPSVSIPAIALTGYATAKDRERALAAGYQLHLAKPVEPKELVEAILSLIRDDSSSSR